MQRLLSVLGCLLLVSFVVCSGIESGVVSIEPHRLTSFIAKNTEACVLFCKNDNLYCDTAITALETINRELNNPNVKFGFYDFSELPEPAETQGVKRSGHVIWYRKGIKHAEIEQTSITKLLDWLRLASAQSLKELETSKETQSLISDCANERAAVILFASNPIEKVETALLSIASEYEGIFQFRVVRDSKLIKEFSTGGDNRLGLFNCEKKSKDFLPVDASTTFDKLQNFVLTTGTSRIEKLTGDLVHRNIDLYGFAVIVALPENKQSADKAMKVLEGIVASRADVGFLYDTSAELGSQFREAGASGDVFPTALAVFNAEIPLAFNERLAFNAENLNTWITQVKNKEATPFQKSGKVPANEQGPVYTAVFDNFHEKVLASKKPVVVLFTSSSPQCYACSHSSEQFEQVAAKLQGKGVEFYKYDTYENAFVKTLNSVPAILLYRDGNPVAYPSTTPYYPNRVVTWLVNTLGLAHDEL